MSTVLAFDLGASSGRAILADFDSDEIRYREIHRFENIPTTENGKLCWDFPYLMREIAKGIEIAALKAEKIDSMAFDTWGVDYGLIDENGRLISLPVHYRDTRTQGVPKKIFEKISPPELYKKTGIQIMNINTLFQLASEENKNIGKILFMPDLIAYMLCKAVSAEQTIASTSQMLNLHKKQWQKDIFALTEMPESALPEIVTSASVAGEYKGIKVIKAAGHDTQCAVCAMPCDASEVPAFLSCGTWSLIGCECDEPVMTEKSMRDELSNELGANGKINYLKNISGLWLIQELRRNFKEQGRDYTYADMEKLARESKPFLCFIDPDDPAFSSHGDMPQKIRKRCAETDQEVPQSDGEIIRTVYESLAMKYRFALRQISDNTGKEFTVLHLLGGGTKDPFLCQMTANSTGIPVVAGPAEATALGNILLQLVALGEIDSIEQGRAIIRQTEKVREYMPGEADKWDCAYNRFLKLLNK